MSTKVVVIYWTDYDIGEKVHYHPICPWRAVEFKDRQKAVDHLKADYYILLKDSHDVYCCNYQHVKTFAKILQPQLPEPPRKSLWPGTIAH